MHESRLREVKRYRVSPTEARPSYNKPRAASYQDNRQPLGQGRHAVLPATQRNVSIRRVLAKHGFAFGAMTFISVGVAFWIGFLMTFVCLWGIKALYIPPKILHFPIPLDYDPFMRSESGDHLTNPSYPVYELKNPPALFLSNRDMSGLSFDEDSVRFQAAVPPEAVLGFTDLRYNISGLLTPMVPKGSILTRGLSPVWNLFWRMLGVNPRRDSHWGNLKGYPVQMVLEFEYNPYGFRWPTASSAEYDAAHAAWLANSAIDAVDFRVVLYSDQGQKLLQLVNSFFPEHQPASRLGEALSVVTSSVFSFFLSLTPFSMADATWKLGRVVLVENLVLPSMAPHTALNRGRYLKVRISPKLPIKNMHLIFQSEVRGVAALLQNYPTFMPFMLSVAVATLLSIFVLVVCVAAAVVLSLRAMSTWPFSRI